MLPPGRRGDLQRSLLVAEQNGDAVCDDVGNAVAVHIADGDTNAGDRVCYRRCELPIPKTESDLNDGNIAR